MGGRAQTWTRVFGWVQLVFYLVNIIQQVLDVNDFIQGLEEIDYNDDESYEMYGPIVAKWLVRVVGVWFTIRILNVTMAIVLLKGSYNKKPNYLLGWMVYTAGFVIWHGIRCLLGSYPGRVPLLLLAISNCCWIRTVGLHKKEIERGFHKLGSAKV